MASAGLVPFVLPFLVGESYSPAIGSTRILLIASAVSIPFLWQRSIYLVRNLVRDFLMVNLIVTIAYMSLFPFLVWNWGYIGAAGAMLALQIVGTIARAVCLSKRPAE